MAETKPDTKKLTFAELTKLPVGDLTVHLKKIVRVDAAVAKAKDAVVASLQFHGKCVAALKRAYVARLNAHEIAADTTFKKYFEQNAGGSLPGRVEAIAALFNSLCLTLDGNGKPLLAEEFFDSAAVDWLEKANAIVKKAMKDHGAEGWKTCDDVLDLVNALSKPGDALKKINEIRKRQKGEGEAGNGSDAVAPLTTKIAVEFLKSQIKNASKLTDDAGFELYRETVALGDSWGESGVPTPRWMPGPNGTTSS